jgi:hypothetical protein
MTGRWRVLALIVLALVALLVVRSGGTERPARLGGTVVALESTLNFRSQAASVALGDGTVLMWGGRSLSPDSGNVFDPTTRRWEHLPKAPGPGRFAAAAVWTGTEALIWGGSTTTDPMTLDASGIAWNPTTRSWRRIPAAPLAMIDARGVAFPGGVLFTGGSTLGPSRPIDLWLDVRTGRWTVVHNPVRVLNTAWHDGQLVGTGPTPTTVGQTGPGTWSVLRFDERRHSWTQAAREVQTSWLALASSGGTLSAVAVDGEKVRALVYEEPAQAWTEVAKAEPVSSVVTIEPSGYPPATVWTGDRLVLGGGGGLVSWRPETRELSELVDRRLRSFGGTVVWTGTQVVSLVTQGSKGWVWTPPT